MRTGKTLKKFGLSDCFIYAIILLLMIATLYPVWYVAMASVSDPVKAYQSGGVLVIPKGIQWGGYRHVMDNKEIWSGYGNTIFYTVAATFLNVVLTAALAYPLSKKKLMLRKPITMFIMFTMFFNGGMIPTYLVMNKIGILNTRAAVILPGLVSVFNFIIMRTNFEAIPESLEESAYLDGADDWTIFWKIIMPLSKSTLAMMVLFYGVQHWSSWFNEMLYLRDRGLWPLALITREIIINSSRGVAAESGTMTMEMSENIKYCTIMVTTLPILCLYPFLQKYFVKGQMAGAVKG